MIRQVAATVVALCLSASPLHAQNTKLTVSEASASVHKTPSTGSPVIGKAPRGTELIVTREVGDWVKVSWPSSADGAGYVRASALTRGNAAAPAAAKAPASAKAAPAATTAKPAAAGAKTAATAKAAPAPASAKAAAAEPTVPVSSKAAVMPTPTTAPVTVRTEQIPTAPSPARTLYVSPTHIFGVGAVAGGSTMGFGGSARAWKKGRIGFQMEVSRYSFDSIDLLSRATSTDIAPGVLFALNDRVSDTLWVRPYLGVAGHLIHSSRRDLIFTDVTESANSFGARAFLGAEMSMAALPQFALSADAGYYHLPEPFVGFEPGGMGFSISAHWYVK